MKKKGLLALLLTVVMLFSSIGTVFATEGENTETTEVPVWTAEDFTYGEETPEIYPAGEMGLKLTPTVWVITGFSESGKAKAEVNKDLVIPAVDPNGKKIQGVGKNAFNKAYLDSVEFPKNVKAPYDDTTWSTTGKGLTERGDFFIGYGAFRYNNFKTLELPDGVILLDSYAFANNTELASVKFPRSIMQIRSGAFYKDAVAYVQFPDVTDFALQMDSQTFATNQIQMVKLPANAEKLHKWTFIQNTGMEAVASGTTAEKKGGVVYMYMNAETAGAYMDTTSVVQKLILGEFWTAEDYTYAEDGTTVTGLSETGQIKIKVDAWCADDFTYDEAGTTVTGLSDTGKLKIKLAPEVRIPEFSSTGATITTIGDGANMQGIFVYAEAQEDGTTKYYAPSDVDFPRSVTKIGKWSFALNASLTYEAEMKSIDLPSYLVEIGQTAFQNSKLTSIEIPDSVTTMGTGAFTGSSGLTSIKLSKNVTAIPQSAFASGNDRTENLETLVIPEGVTSVGRSAFAGTRVEGLVLPSTLTTIDQQSFQNHQLTELTIPGSVTIIGKYAFRMNQESLTPMLTDVTLNEGLVTIGQYAFDNNAITEIHLPSTTVLTANNKAADLIFGTASKPADPIVRVIVSDESKVEAYNTDYANSYSHVVVYEKPIPKLTSATLQLENDITVIFKAKLSSVEPYRDPFIDVVHEMENGTTKTTRIGGMLNADGSAYEFKYTGVSAKQVGDLLDATISAWGQDGQIVTGTAIEDYSVKQYCMNQLQETEAGALATLLVDLLNFASEAQEYFGYKTDALANAGLTDAEKAYASADSVLDSVTDITNTQYETIDNPMVTWKSGNLHLLNKTVLRAKFTYEGNVEDLLVFATVGGVEYEINEFEELGSGQYAIYFDRLTAAQYEEAIDFRVLVKGEIASNTLRYSVSSYVARKQNSEDVTDVISAMMKYGKAAAAYISAK